MPSDPRLESAVRQIEFARSYTLSLLEDIDEADWYLRPADAPTHVAWQVGHLAMAEYGLTMFRQRGRAAADTGLMSSRFRKRFSRGSDPAQVLEEDLPVGEIRQVFNRVHDQALRELAEYDPVMLDEPIDEPYAAFPSKLGGLLFCAHHEMLHAGQIGLLRRLLQKPPVR